MLEQFSTCNGYIGARRKRPGSCLADAGELHGTMSDFTLTMPRSFSLWQWPRKWWEWDYIADCAEQLDILSQTTTALGLGAGNEPLIFYFANKCKRVIASDLYSDETAWKEARFEKADRILSSSPIPFNRNSVEVVNADMRATGLEAASIDFVWSCSSIEHVPTLLDLFDVFDEIDRVLRLGGYAILTTEYSLTESTYLLPGVNAWNSDIFHMMINSFPGFKLIGATDFRYNWLHPANGSRPRRYPACRTMPEQLGNITHYTRSGTMINPVGLSLAVPVGFVIQKISQDGVLPWREAKIPDRIKIFSEGINEFLTGNNEPARDLLETIVAQEFDDDQLRHHAFRYAIDARARLGEMSNKQEFADRISTFVTSTPIGAVQDPDSLDICGYLVGECGRKTEAISIYERCLLTPSISRDHLFEIAIKYLALAENKNEKQHAIETVSSIFFDLMNFGMIGGELQSSFIQPSLKKLPPEIVEGVVSAVRARLRKTVLDMSPIIG